jgi:hypothetical protein
MSPLSILAALVVAVPSSPSLTPTMVAPVMQQQGLILDSTYGCLACHADKRSAFVEGVHAERGIQCRDCHGGDPSATALPAAHRGGFTGSPGKVATVALCGSCHSNPNKMRQYGLMTGQATEFRTSRHGILLLEKHDENAPTCTDCHDAHKILRPDDARSTVYPTNIAGTCGRCHEDKALMAKYRLPTDQVSQFNRSAHGVALLADQNFAAPTCLGCHGSHSALPPATTEIANVCSRCHVLVGTAFESGPHGKAAHAGKLAGCLGCHANHDTERVSVDSLAATCTKCHAAGTRAETLGQTIQKDATQAAGDLVAAQEAIEKLDRMGKQTGDLRFRYQTARTAFLQITEVQHRLDLDRLEELTRKVRSISRDLRGAAEAASEAQWEHRLWLAPVWFLALAWISLSWLTLRRIERKGPRE